MSSPSLPSPPLTEAALSIGFQEMHGLLRDQLDGLRDEKFKDRYPRQEEMGPFSPMIETEDGGLVAVPSASALTNIRRWFLSRSGHELVQAQRNWFARNWRIAGRGVTGSDPPDYPGYEALRDGFLRDLGLFARYAEENGLGELSPLQCEISYVSHLPAGGAWTTPGELGRALRIFAPRPEGLPSDVEAMRIISQYVIPGEDGGRRGRLYARAETASSGEGHVAVLTLFARAAVDSQAAAAEFMDIGHQWITRAYREYLTPEAAAEFQ